MSNIITDNLFFFHLHFHSNIKADAFLPLSAYGCRHSTSSDEGGFIFSSTGSIYVLSTLTLKLIKELTRFVKCLIKESGGKQTSFDKTMTL